MRLATYHCSEGGGVETQPYEAARLRYYRHRYLKKAKVMIMQGGRQPIVQSVSVNNSVNDSEYPQ